MFQRIKRKFEGEAPEARNAPAGTRAALLAAPDPSRPVAIMSDQPTIVLDHVSKWYGDLVAVSDLSFSIGPGVTALLGPNGSGKSTSLKMICGLLGTSTGTVTIDGLPARGDPKAYKNLGVVLDIEQVYPYLSGREFVRMNALLQKLPDVDAATELALATVEMTDAADPKVGGYSKGMRQRIKLAGALVHDPNVILMDEPLNGTDPEQRAHMIRLMWELGRQGKTLLVSSHVLSEVERFAENIIVIINGKLAAAGNYRTIRDRIDNHPHIVRLGSPEPRKLASALVTLPQISSVRIDKDGRVFVETSELRDFYRMVPRLAKEKDVRLTELHAADESLESVFSYLVER
jgi:ABC-2 type transport system ATP-binding protein